MRFVAGAFETQGRPEDTHDDEGFWKESPQEGLCSGSVSLCLCSLLALDSRARCFATRPD